jgi:hypothetical protein
MSADPNNGNTPIQSAKDFDKDAKGAQARWTVEVNAAKKSVKDFQAKGKKILDRFQDKRADSTLRDQGATRVNLFTSNIQTQRAMTYGKTPRCEVSRRYADPDDDIARVAALMLTRLLNLDIEHSEDDYAAALALALDDFQLPGLGVARVRYDASFVTEPAIDPQVDPTTGQELAPGIPEREVKDDEAVHVDYIHWRDFLWSPARVWHEVRWIGYAADLSRDDFDERFPGKREKIAANAAKPQDQREDGLQHDPWERIRVWEIWCKEDRKVYWYAEGATEILDTKEDPLKLEGFFPTPRPMASNLTTDAFMPVGDFVLAQDLYDEVDSLSTRITILERACKVVGVYDSSAEGVQRMLTEGVDNELVPVDNWAIFAERGGLKGQVDWLPIDQVVGALEKLRGYRTELIQLLYEVTGMSDIMRGSSDAQETATAQAIKAKFASTRMSSRQDEFARFATDLLKLKAELILTLCEDQFVLDGSNIQNTADAPLAPEALKLLRDHRAKFRIEVKPENISITNFQELKTERMEVLTGISGFLQAATPMMQMDPQSAPLLLDLLKWTVAGLRGASTIESTLDQAISQVKQRLANPQPPQPDPKIEAQREKAQLDVGVAKEKAKVQIQTLHQKNGIEQQKIQIDAKRAQMEMQKDMQQMRMDAMRDSMGLNQPQQPAGQNPQQHHGE